MAGGEVFKFATRVIGESLEQAALKAGITLRDLKLIVPHQANERIIQAAARQLDVDRKLFMTNLEHYGNTSAASIPIALVEAIQQGRVRESDYIALVGFGGGLTWASIIVQWSGPLGENRFGTQRRQFTYALAAWRARVRRFIRRYTDLFNRIRPKHGRMLRLRKRIEQHIDDI